jgi:hypothetical protein
VIAHRGVDRGIEIRRIFKDGTVSAPVDVAPPPQQPNSVPPRKKTLASWPMPAN